VESARVAFAQPEMVALEPFRLFRKCDVLSTEGEIRAPESASR
jgi:hypothetical protein